MQHFHIEAVGSSPGPIAIFETKIPPTSILRVENISARNRVLKAQRKHHRQQNKHQNAFYYTALGKSYQFPSGKMLCDYFCHKRLREIYVN